MYIKGITAAGRLGGHVFFICVLLVFLNGCAVLRPKKVAPPPSRPAVGKPAEIPAGQPARKRYPVAKPPREERYIEAVPPAKERPVVTGPPVEGPAVVTRQPVEEGYTAPGPRGQERPVAARPPVSFMSPVEKRPVMIEPPREEHPVVTGPPPVERPTATVPPAGEPPEDALAGSAVDYRPVTGKASSIYHQAEEELEAGNYPSAEMLLERALRIEPRNAHYWYILGLAKFRQKQYSQAVQFCLKAESLAGSQPGLMARNQVLLTQAKKAAGMQ